MKTKKIRLQPAALVGCCSFAAFVAVAVLFCAIASANDRDVLVTPPESEACDTLIVNAPDFDRILETEIPSALFEQRFVQHQGSENERNNIMRDYLLRTQEGTRLISLAALFLISLCFLLTWAYVEQLKKPKTIVKEITRNVFFPEGCLKREDLRENVLNGYEERLPAKYNYNGVQGTAEFILWVYDRIMHSDDIEPRHRSDAIINLRSGNIICLYDYDMLVKHYARFRIGIDDICRMIVTLEDYERRLEQDNTDAVGNGERKELECQSAMSGGESDH